MTEKREEDCSPDEKLEGMKGEKDGGEDEGIDEQVMIYRGWKAMPYVIGNETFEKLGTIGTSANLLVYFTSVFHMSSVTAAMLIQVFYGTTNISPVLGAFLSDTYLSRYFTIGFASIASLMGMFILTLTPAFKTLHPPPCDNGENCATASPLQLTFIFLSFALLVVGAGGIRPCSLAFGADQFNPRTESGRKGINSFFNWYYFTLTFAVMLSCTVIVYVQSNISWIIGLGIPTLLMLFSCSFFFLGTKLYVRVKPEGSPFSNVTRVLAAAYRKRAQKLPDEDYSHLLFNPPLVGSTTLSKLRHTDQFRCLDKASIITSSDEVDPDDGEAINPWRLCSSQHVEEVKCIVRILPIWSTGMLYNMALTQQGTYVVFQALQSDCHLGNTGFQIPAGSFTVFNMLALTIWIPIYDRIVVPRLQRMTKIEGGMTLLQRMGIEIIIAIISLLVAAFVEEKRRSIALRDFTAVSPMSGLWLIPQLMICGVSEGFAMIAQVEFYYKQFPENMRSVAGAFLFLGFALSSYFCSFVVMVVHRTTGGNGRENWLAGDLNRGRLDLFYLLTAAMAVANLAYFIICARWYKYKDLKSGADADEISMEVVEPANEVRFATDDDEIS